MAVPPAQRQQASQEPDVAGLMTVRQAIDVLDATPVAPRVERRPLAAAQGYRLAEDVVADRDFPPFEKSLMDGYAVRRADVERTAGVELAVVGEVAAGQLSDRTIGAGEAVAIMTGAPLPDGADGVVPVEEVEGLGESASERAGETTVEADPLSPPLPRRIRVRRAVAAGKYVAARGSDLTAGHVVLTKGTILGPAQLAAAASVGAAEVAVVARPRVAVLGTGDELVPVDQTPGPAQIRNSNNVMLVALLRRLGCDPVDLGTVRDDPDAVRATLADGLDASRFDALFVTGGMSMGAYDYVPRTLVELGVDLHVTKLRIKPGKPFVFGSRSDGATQRRSDEGQQQQETEPSPSSPSSLRGCVAPSLSPLFVFGLPGNPVSAFVCTLRLASRLLARMAGGAVTERWLSGRIDAGLPANGPREFYQPAVRVVAPGNKSSQANFAAVTPLAWKGSADVFTLAAANVLIVRGENEPPLPKGTVIRVLEIG